MLPTACLPTGSDVLFLADLFYFQRHLVEAYCGSVTVMLPVCMLSHHTPPCPFYLSHVDTYMISYQAKMVLLTDVSQEAKLHSQPPLLTMRPLFETFA